MTRKILLALFVFAIAACGKRGDPHPPVPVIPQPTSDLVLTQRADRVILSWSYPSLTTAGRNLTSIDRISIYRYEEALPVGPGGRDPQTLTPGDGDLQPIALFSKVPTIAQTQFAKLGNRIESIEKANLAGATAGARLQFTDTPPFRSVDGRPLRLTYAVVTEGETARSEYSNLAILVPLPPPVAPEALTATAEPDGVTLAWKAPERTMGGADAPVIAGYNIFRTAPSTAPGDLDAPVNPAPVRGTTYRDTPVYGEHEYRVAAVIAAGPPLMQSALSAPVTVNFRDQIAPPAPASITPLIEQRAVRMIWEAVEASDLAGYRVYRAEGIGHNNAIREIGSVPLVNEVVTATSIVDPNVNPGIAFRYAVTSIDKSGNESARVWTEWVLVPKTQ